MPKKQISSLNAELKRLLKLQPDTDVMELLIADLPGVLRGKRIRGAEFEKTLRDGFCLPGGTVLLDTLGDVVDGIPWSDSDGDPDIMPPSYPGVWHQFHGPSGRVPRRYTDFIPGTAILSLLTHDISSSVRQRQFTKWV